MRVINQTTLANPATLSGIGLHSGASCRARLRPARAGSGIAFRVPAENGSSDLAPIAATTANVSSTSLGTSLTSGGRSVRTIEHLLAAAAIAGVDNMIVDVTGGELPILDGSAAPFIEAILGAGIMDLSAPRAAIRIAMPTEMTDGARSIRAMPSEGRVLDVSIDFEDPAIGAQSLSIDLDDRDALLRLGRARTFCRLKDVTAMRARGLSLGGSLDNAVVVDGDRIVNPAGLRDPQEFVLHKALDLLGDLTLAGAPIIGTIRAIRTGHDLNVTFLRRLTAEPGAIEIIPTQARRALKTA